MKTIKELDQADLEMAVACYVSELTGCNVQPGMVRIDIHPEVDNPMSYTPAHATATVEVPEDPIPHHTSKCGTAYRGCSPDCTFEKDSGESCGD